MSDKAALLAALAPILEAVRGIDSKDPAAALALARRFPLDGPELRRVRALVREGVEARWLCEREAGAVRYSRVLKSEGGGLSIDAVHMSTEGGAHTHPGGEIDLCFAVSGAPRFDGRPEGWTVYAPNTWHVPTVQGGAMDILYFLPGGAIAFGPKPEGSVGVGLQAG